MSQDVEKQTLSRAEAEVLCVLHAVGDGCPTTELAPRLGLSRTLSAAIEQGMEPLVAQGLLVVEDGRFLVTDAGQARLQSRLEELGIT